MPTAPGSKLDTTLASNWATALAPRPDVAIKYGGKYLGQQILDIGRRIKNANIYGMLRGHQFKAGRRIGIKKPNSIVASSLSTSKNLSINQLRCAETGRAHFKLPQKMIKEVKAYFSVSQIAADPDRVECFTGTCFGARHFLKDAFHAKVMVSGSELDVLPQAVLTSSLLNQGPEPYGAKTIDSQSKIWENFPNTLFDPKTGFAAAITVRENPEAAEKEIVIGFGPMRSQGGTLAQGVRCVMNILGLTPTKNFSQASKLTKIIQAHVEELNEKLMADNLILRAEGKSPHKLYKLTLAGHSMGGGLATYAALRANAEALNAKVDGEKSSKSKKLIVNALVTNPMRLGLLSRAKVGFDVMKRAPEFVTEAVVKSDWLSDNSAARVYAWTGNSAGAIGKRFLIPVADEIQCQKNIREKEIAIHDHIQISLNALEESYEREHQAQAQAQELEELAGLVQRLVRPPSRKK